MMNQWFLIKFVKISEKSLKFLPWCPFYIGAKRPLLKDYGAKRPLLKVHSAKSPLPKCRGAKKPSAETQDSRLIDIDLTRRAFLWFPLCSNPVHSRKYKDFFQKKKFIQESMSAGFHLH